MLCWIKRFLKLDTSKPVNDANFIWCLVGNVIGQHDSGSRSETGHGTKHFSAHTKVYCYPIQWGDGYKNIKVIGQHRKRKRLICVVMPSKFIRNWRLQKVYQPYVLKSMQSQLGWTNSDKDRETILTMLVHLNG